MAESEVVKNTSTRKRKRPRKEKSSRQEHNDSNLKKQKIQDAPEVTSPRLKKAESKTGNRDGNLIKSEVGKPEKSQNPIEQTEAKETSEKQLRAGKKNKNDSQSINGGDPVRVSDQSVTLPEESRREMWFVSGPVGGRLLHLDPHFTNDEEYFAVAKKQGLYIYYSSTSMLFKFLPVKSPDQLSSFCFSATNPQNVYIATNAGYILCWDWEVEQLIGQWTLGSPISSITAVADAEAADDIIFTLRKTNRCLIEQHTPGRGKESGKLRSQKLLEVARPLRMVQVLAKGDIIIAAYNRGLYVGELHKQGVDSTNDAVYTWREVSCMEPLTCFNARYRNSETAGSSKKKKSAKKESRNSLDLAIGGVRGTIIVLRDFLRKLKVEKEERKNITMSSDLLSPRVLHWHREAVSSVKWSQDGNYLISGGRETVLIIWQLETGRRQELPHLTSAIDNIAVSPSGSSYLVQLADNSAMVLSTSELSPTAYVAGFQSRIVSKARSEAPQIRTAEGFKNKITADTLYAKFAAAMNPRKSNELLLAAASSQSWTEPKDKFVPTPHLQSFNIAKDCQIARQALTRNHATSVNIGPEATKLEEPSVILLDVTSDGRWLATVEEWVPPLQDLEYLAPDDESRIKEQARRREIYLKFWSWDNESNNWTLQTRINHPHRSFETAESGITFDLATHPKRAQFATVGEDCIVRIWKAVPRLRDGTVVVRGDSGEELYTWKCRYEIELERPMVDLDDECEENKEPPMVTHLARLCYSQDASIIGICHQLPGRSPSLGKYYLADARNGAIVKTGLGWFGDNLHDAAILDGCLIILSDILVIWDLTTYELVFGLKLEHERLRPRTRLVTALLTVNPNSNTIAVTLSYITKAGADRSNRRKNKKKHKKKGKESAEQEEIDQVDEKIQRHKKDTSNFVTVTDLYIFAPRASAKLLFRQEFPEVVAALLPSQTSKGYHLIDVDAQIYTINYRPPLPSDIAVNNGSQLERAYSITDDATVDGLNASASPSGSMHGDGVRRIINGEGKIDTSDLVRSEVQDHDRDDRAPLSTKVINGEHIEIDGDGADDEANKDESAKLLRRTEYDKPVVRPEELAAVLDVAPSHALPPVEQLMYGVINLFSRKKRGEGET